MTGRKPHYLDPTEGSQRPEQVIFFDTETRPEKIDDKTTRQVLKLGVAWHCRTNDRQVLALADECVIRSADQFWTWLDGRIRKKSTCYLVAHNIVFDLTVLNGWQQLVDLGWQLDSFYTKASVSIFRWTNGERHLIGVDNTNLFAGKLATWGDILGLPKLSVDFATVSQDDLLVYCRRDVEIMARLWRLWIQFLDDNDCGSFKVTVGSTAFNTWRHKYLQSSVHIHAEKGALQLEREAYRGARVEVLFQGRREDGPFYYLDVNNMYGWVLSRYEFPVQLVGSFHKVSLSMLLRKLNDFDVIARVALDVDRPVFPYTYQGHVCYPLGRFVTTLTTPEVIYAIQQGWLLNVGAMAWYKAAPLFRDYVLHWYNKRQEYNRAGNQGYEAICKLLINSLYGKFGQQGFRQRVMGRVPLEDVYTQSVYNVRSRTYARQVALGGLLYEETKEGESYNSFPAIAAHVTAYARLQLYRLADLAGPGNCYYMDTDSILVNQSGYDALKHLVIPRQLGALKVELESPWVEINAPKDYRMEGRTRTKGIRPDAVDLGGGVFEQDQWVRLHGMLERGDLSKYVIRRVVKHQRRVVYSGLVQPGGWVRPFQLAEDLGDLTAPAALLAAQLASPVGCVVPVPEDSD